MCPDDSGECLVGWVTCMFVASDSLIHPHTVYHCGLRAVPGIWSDIHVRTMLSLLQMLRRCFEFRTVDLAVPQDLHHSRLRLRCRFSLNSSSSTKFKPHACRCWRRMPVCPRCRFPKSSGAGHCKYGTSIFQCTRRQLIRVASAQSTADYEEDYHEYVYGADTHPYE